MDLSEETKQKIKDEYKEWFNKQYANNSLKERQKLGQFFTPPELSIEMLKKVENLDGKILDPCAGSGNLLVAAIFAGADPKNIYAIEIDKNIFEICKKRLTALGVPESNIKNADARIDDSYNF